jgi:hypothetical protein
MTRTIRATAIIASTARDRGLSTDTRRGIAGTRGRCAVGVLSADSASATDEHTNLVTQRIFNAEGVDDDVSPRGWGIDADSLQRCRVHG